MTKIEVGQPIPIELQVFDGNAKLSVTATVIDDLGVVVAQKQLNHFYRGLYMSAEKVEMPDARFVVVQFETNSPDYEIATDTFIAIPKPSPPEKFIVGQVINKAKSNEYIIGVVEK